MLPTHASMREFLLDEIRCGRYRTGDQLSTLDELNMKFDAIGPSNGNRAHATENLVYLVAPQQFWTSRGTIRPMRSS